MLEKYRELVEKHDLTFTFSDDPKVYRKGQAELKEIQLLASRMPTKEDHERAREIWNEQVEKKLKPNYWEMFKWEKEEI